MKTDVELAELFKTIQSWDTLGTDTQCFIFEEDDETVIIFAASNSKEDWKINFNFPKLPYRNMEAKFRVHRGFLDEWKRIQSHFLDYFENKLIVGEELKPVTIVGWSYGGAMATLAMEGLWHDIPVIRDTLRLVTFGSPRVIGFFNFSKVKDRWQNTTRYSNCSDFVTCIPFILMGFHHVNKVRKIGRKFCIFDVFKTGKSHQISAYIESLKSK